MSTDLQERVFQTADLASAARREFIKAAREGQARFRAPDGEALVMTRQATLDHLAHLRDYVIAYVTLDNALMRPRADRRVADYGAWAFMEVFDDEDLTEFQGEINDALIRAVAAQDVRVVEETLAAWRRSARTLSDSVAREILDGKTEDDDWVDLEEPAEA
ncbi:hypothetical protein [Phytoactinopolyspora mesophila]|uniref:Prevent-host-death protein n=1 Tax=Phytoactinopolyspora mesophila TaxID=2650750 RepID=A0A7K3MD66_9ACTN|nr:hypothetical protein [Phytoactinopolyspora mesophila]NDL61146.1 hypothetical protein [Phytoactinopolyspora mesophila]